MKIKFLFMVCAAMLLSIAAQAQVEVRITGSTAFRANAYNAIVLMYDSGYTANAGAGTVSSSANQVTFSGKMTGLFGAGTTVIVKTSYSGSVQGIQSVTANSPVTFYATATPGDITTVSQTAHFAFSDGFQSSTAFTTPALQDNQVGVLPFVFVRGAGTSSTVANVTSQIARALLPLGQLPLMQFTGNSADSAIVNLIGRDSGSGTRLVVQADTGYGVFTSSTLRNTNATCTGFVDSAGFSSGSEVVKVLNVNCGAANPSIGYVGIPDGLNVTGQPANWLTFNGVTYTAENVRNGAYSLWGYEHLYNRSDLPAEQHTWLGTASTAGSFINKIDQYVASISGIAQPTAIAISSMNVSRQADGGPITP